MTAKTIASSVYDWVDERLGLSELAAFARHKTVPVHSQSFWYYWGGISLFFFLVQCLTGVLLLVYYRPGAGSLRVGPPDHLRDALRLADPLGPLLVRPT